MVEVNIDMSGVSPFNHKNVMETKLREAGVPVSYKVFSDKLELERGEIFSDHNFMTNIMKITWMDTNELLQSQTKPSIVAT